MCSVKFKYTANVDLNLKRKILSIDRFIYYSVRGRVTTTGDRASVEVQNIQRRCVVSENEQQ